MRIGETIELLPHSSMQQDGELIAITVHVGFPANYASIESIQAKAVEAEKYLKEVTNTFLQGTDLVLNGPLQSGLVFDALAMRFTIPLKWMRFLAAGSIAYPDKVLDMFEAAVQKHKEPKELKWAEVLDCAATDDIWYDADADDHDDRAKGKYIAQVQGTMYEVAAYLRNKVLQETVKEIR